MKIFPQYLEERILYFKNTACFSLVSFPADNAPIGPCFIRLAPSPFIGRGVFKSGHITQFHKLSLYKGVL